MFYKMSTNKKINILKKVSFHLLVNILALLVNFLIVKKGNKDFTIFCWNRFYPNSLSEAFMCFRNSHFDAEKQQHVLRDVVACQRGGTPLCVSILSTHNKMITENSQYVTTIERSDLWKGLQKLLK